MASRDSGKPNTVFILSDDQGSSALRCAGNHENQTPNLDALASSGVRFDNFYCTSPVCSPARASILTGRIPSQHGVHGWIRRGNSGKDSIRCLEGQTTYVDVLAERRYECSLSGKWHLGDSAHPQKGFTHWYAHQKRSGNYYNSPMVRDGRLVQEPGYITDNITDDAVGQIRKASADDAPFYASVHYTAPHSPWVEGEHPREILDLYKEYPFDSAPKTCVIPTRCTDSRERTPPNA